MLLWVQVPSAHQNKQITGGEDMNVGTDLNLYLWILITLPIVVVGGTFIYLLVDLIIKDYHSKEKVNRRIGILLILFALFAFMTWIRFGAYGPGEESMLTPAHKDGANVLNDSAPDEKPKEEIKKEAEDSKSEVLKQVQDHAWGKGEEEDFQKYLKEALRVKNYQD